MTDPSPGASDADTVRRLLGGDLQWSQVPPHRWPEFAGLMVNAAAADLERLEATPRLTQALRHLGVMALSTTDPDARAQALEALDRAATAAKETQLATQGADILVLPERVQARIGRRASYGPAVTIALWFTRSGNSLSSADPRQLPSLLVGRALTLAGVIAPTVDGGRVLDVRLFHRDVADLLAVTLRRGPTAHLDAIRGALPNVQLELHELSGIVPGEVAACIEDLVKRLKVVSGTFEGLVGQRWSPTRGEINSALSLLDDGSIPLHAELMQTLARKLVRSVSSDATAAATSLSAFATAAQITFAAVAVRYLASGTSNNVFSSTDNEKANADHQVRITALGEIRDTAWALDRLVSVWTCVDEAANALREFSPREAVERANVKQILLGAVAWWGRARKGSGRLILSPQTFSDLVMAAGHRFVEAAATPGAGAPEGWNALVSAVELLSELRPLVGPDAAERYGNAMDDTRAVAVRVGIEIAATGRMPKYMALATGIVEATTRWEDMPIELWPAVALGIGAIAGRPMPDHAVAQISSVVTGLVAFCDPNRSQEPVQKAAARALGTLTASLWPFAVLADDDAKSRVVAIATTIGLGFGQYPPMSASILEELRAAEVGFAPYPPGAPDTTAPTLPRLPPLPDQLEPPREDPFGGPHL